MLGVCTRYCFHEATQVAVRLADWQADKGREATIKSVSRSSPDVSRWDEDVDRNAKRLFTDWARECSTIFWTHVPRAEQITWCSRKGIKTAVYPFANEISDHHKPVLRQADVVLCANAPFYEYVTKRLGVKDAVYLPYDNGLPFTRKHPKLKPNNVWVLLPIYDRESAKMERTALDLLGRLLAAREDVIASVMYNSSTIGSWGKKRCRVFQKDFGERIRILKGLSLEQRPLIFRDHDLTMWPVHFDGMGITPLMSLTMGTPVVTFNLPVYTELLNKKNSVPVPCPGSYNQVGVPRLEPDYNIYERCLQNAAIDRKLLASLQQSSLNGLEARRSIFNEVMDRVII